MWAFCCIPNFGVFKNMHFCTFLFNLFKKKYCFVIQEVQPITMVLNLKDYLKNIYTRHYFKMRKILIGAKLLLMSIFARDERGFHKTRSKYVNLESWLFRSYFGKSLLLGHTQRKRYIHGRSNVHPEKTHYNVCY